jgi:hypothetical protein
VESSAYHSHYSREARRKNGNGLVVISW